MNTIKSVWYGWGTLIVAGAGAYYFAKKDINKDRAERAALELKKRKLNMMLEYGGSQAIEDEAQARSISSSYGDGMKNAGSSSSSSSNNNNNVNNNNVNNNSNSNSSDWKSDLNTTAKGVKSGYRNSSTGAGSEEGTITRWPDVMSSPSREARSGDPAPTEHVAPVEGAPQPPPLPQQQGSRYEATQPYRTRRGDRFS